MFVCVCVCVCVCVYVCVLELINSDQANDLNQTVNELHVLEV